MIKKIIQIPIIAALLVTPLVAQSGGEESRVGTTAAPF